MANAVDARFQKSTSTSIPEVDLDLGRQLTIGYRPSKMAHSNQARSSEYPSVIVPTSPFGRCTRLSTVILLSACLMTRYGG